LFPTANILIVSNSKYNAPETGLIVLKISNYFSKPILKSMSKTGFKHIYAKV